MLRGDGQDLVHTARITPVHPASEGISAKTIRELIWRALEQLPPQADPLPAHLVAAESLSDWDAACRQIHFPADEHELASARERLKFDELFMLELGVAFRRQRLAADRTGVAHDPRRSADGGTRGDAPVRTHPRAASARWTRSARR